MDKKKKALSLILKIEKIIPWLVLVGGIPAICCWFGEYYELLEIFYSIAMITGQVVLVLEFILGIISLILLITFIVNKKNRCKENIILGVSSWLCSAFCMAGTFILVLLVISFTYAQGI
ncbi:MAG: hypothetical protein U0L18_08205 [Acutalibacteraceae bacterium]|jgi:hypothetical protein|nr:hypothetical protein [Acutalibacteraceae bacterium]